MGDQKVPNQGAQAEKTAMGTIPKRSQGRAMGRAPKAPENRGRRGRIPARNHRKEERATECSGYKPEAALDRPNSRKTKRDFIWNAPNPRVNSETQVQLAAPGTIGHREEDPEIEKNFRERSAKELLLHKEELLKADERIKPTVVLPVSKDIPRRDEHSDSDPVEPPPFPAVTPEARKAIRTLEIIDAEKQRLDERDQRRAEKKSKFKKKKLTGPEKARKEDPGRTLHSRKATKK
jgi:hypothetical protein